MVQAQLRWSRQVALDQVLVPQKFCGVIRLEEDSRVVNTITISIGKVQVSLGHLWLQKSPMALGGALGSQTMPAPNHIAVTLARPGLEGSAPQDPLRCHLSSLACILSD